MACVVAVLAFGSASTPAHEEHARAPENQAAPAPTDRSEAPQKTGLSRWGADYFPNIALVTHEGKSVRFFDDLIKDKVVVINFMYATCPDACSLDTARLAKVQQILGDRVGRDIFMYSITVDPEPPSAKAPSRWIESGDSGVISRRVAAMMWKGHVPSPGFDSYLLSEGARVFNERCTPCHGDTGNGDGDLAEWTMP